MNSKKKLYIITGFLGAGKTTLVKELVRLFAPCRTAVIVNEYGEQGVDGAVLRKEGIEVAEISNGSIFCTCRSDLFVDALVKASGYDVDYLLVETSGLSDPAGFQKILDTVVSLSGDVYEYKGCIAVADALNFHKVIKTAVPVKNQIAVSSLVLLNKVDRASPGQVAAAEEEIRKIKPDIRVEETTYCRTDPSWIEGMDKFDRTGVAGGILRRKPLGNQRFTVKVERSCDRESLLKWTEGIRHVIFRIKGFVELEDGWYYVDGTSDGVELNRAEPAGQSLLVILAPGDSPAKSVIREIWKDVFGGELSI